jgi:hypothetical protein
MICSSELSASVSGIIMHRRLTLKMQPVNLTSMPDPLHAVRYADKVEQSESATQLLRLLGVECLILGVPTGLAASGLKKGTRSNS